MYAYEKKQKTSYKFKAGEQRLKSFFAGSLNSRLKTVRRKNPRLAERVYFLINEPRVKSHLRAGEYEEIQKLVGNMVANQNNTIEIAEENIFIVEQEKKKLESYLYSPEVPQFANRNIIRVTSDPYNNPLLKRYSETYGNNRGLVRLYYNNDSGDYRALQVTGNDKGALQFADKNRFHDLSNQEKSFVKQSTVRDFSEIKSLWASISGEMIRDYKNGLLKKLKEKGDALNKRVHEAFLKDNREQETLRVRLSGIRLLMLVLSYTYNIEIFIREVDRRLKEETVLKLQNAYLKKADYFKSLNLVFEKEAEFLLKNNALDYENILLLDVKYLNNLDYYSILMDIRKTKSELLKTDAVKKFGYDNIVQSLEAIQSLSGRKMSQKVLPKSKTALKPIKGKAVGKTEKLTTKSKTNSKNQGENHKKKNNDKIILKQIEKIRNKLWKKATAESKKVVDQAKVKTKTKYVSIVKLTKGRGWLIDLVKNKINPEFHSKILGLKRQLKKKIKIRPLIKEFFFKIGKNKELFHIFMKGSIVQVGWNYPDWLHQHLIPGSNKIVNLNYKIRPEVRVNLNKFKKRTLTILTESRYRTVKSIPHNKFGFPIFGKELTDKYPIGKVVFETHVTQSNWKSSRITHFRYATKAFAKYLNDMKKMNPSRYEKYINKYLYIGTKDQLNKTFNNIFELNRNGKIELFTWHHHQESGRMQLVKESDHNPLSHVGGFSIWGK